MMPGRFDGQAVPLMGGKQVQQAVGNVPGSDLWLWQKQLLFGSHHGPVIQCWGEPATDGHARRGQTLQHDDAHASQSQLDGGRGQWPSLGHTGPSDRGEIQRKRKPPFSLLSIREASA